MSHAPASLSFSVATKRASPAAVLEGDDSASGLSPLHQSVPDAKEYFQYTPEHVRRVLHRLHLVNGSSTIQHQWLTKGEFNEVFSDYAQIPHVTLPLRIFDYFLDRTPNHLLPAAALDDAEPSLRRKVRAGEVIILLCVLCDGSRNDRTQLVRDIFLGPHTTEDGSVSQESFKDVLYFLCSAAYKAGLLLKHLPDRRAVDREASPYGAVPVVASTLVDQWVDYSLLNGRLLRRLAAKRASKAEDKEEWSRVQRDQQHAEDVRAKKAALQRRATRARSFSFSEEPIVDVVSAPAGARATTHGGKRSLQSVSSHMSLTGAVSLHKIKKHQTKMSNVMLMVERRTSFSGEEVRVLHDTFRKFAEGGRLNLHSFYRLMTDVYPKALGTANVSMGSLFDGFDNNLSGDLDFKEFVFGMHVLLRGSPAQKCGFVFDVFDENGDKVLTPEDILRFLQHPGCLFAATGGTKSQEAGGGAVVEHSLFAEDLISMFQVGQAVAILDNFDGSLSRPEFIKCLCHQPILYDCMASVMVPGMDEAALPWKEIKHRNTKFSMKALHELWQRCQATKGGLRAMNRERFRVFFVEEFKCPKRMLPLVDRVFKVLDEDDSDSLTWKEVFFGLSRVVGRSVEDRAKFFYSLYDKDGSGSVDRDEITEAVLVTQPEGQDSDATQRQLLKIMAHFDSDGDDSVSLQEFTAACIRDPSLLECFGCLFGSHELMRDYVSGGAAGSAVSGRRSRRKKRRRSGARPRRGSTAGLVDKAAAIQREALQHIAELRGDAIAHMEVLRQSLLDTQSQLHGLGITSPSAKRITRRRSAVQQTGLKVPAPQDPRHPRRSSLPERLIATAALRAAQLASVEQSTRTGGIGQVDAAAILRQQREQRKEREARQQQQEEEARQAALQAAAKKREEVRREARRARAATRQPLTSHGTVQDLIRAGVIPPRSPSRGDVGHHPGQPASHAASHGSLVPSSRSAEERRASGAALESVIEEAAEVTEREDTSLLEKAQQGSFVARKAAQAVIRHQNSKASLVSMSGSEIDLDEHEAAQRTPQAAGDDADGGLFPESQAQLASQGSHRSLVDARHRLWAPPTSRGATPVFKARARPPAREPRLLDAAQPPNLHPHQQWKWYSYDSRLDKLGRVRRRHPPPVLSAKSSPHHVGAPTRVRVAGQNRRSHHPHAGELLPGLSRLSHRRYPKPSMSPMHVPTRGRLESRRHRRRAAARGLTAEELGLEGGSELGQGTGGYTSDAPNLWNSPTNHAGSSPTAGIRPSTLADRMPSIYRRSPSPHSRTRNRHRFSSKLAHSRSMPLPSVPTPPRASPTKRKQAAAANSLDLTIGPDQGTVLNRILSVGRSPHHELASPYGLMRAVGNPAPPNMLQRHGQPPLS